MTAFKIITKELLHDIALNKIRLERAQNELYDAQKEERILQAQLACDTAGTHDMQQTSGFVLIQETCSKCGRVYTC